MERIAQALNAALETLELGGQQHAGGQYHEPVVVQVRLAMEEGDRQLQRYRWDRVCDLHLSGEVDYELRVLAGQHALYLLRQSEL